MVIDTNYIRHVYHLAICFLCVLLFLFIFPSFPDFLGGHFLVLHFISTVFLLIPFCFIFSFYPRDCNMQLSLLTDYSLLILGYFICSEKLYKKLPCSSFCTLYYCGHILLLHMLWTPWHIITCFALNCRLNSQEIKERKKQSFYLPTCLPLLELSVSPCSFVFPSGIAPLQFEVLPLALLALRVCWL